MLPMPPESSAPQPLGLTVHSLPEAGVPDPARTRSGRWKMLAVLLVCAAPVIASYFTYYVVRPEGRSSFGTLIDPQHPMPDVQGQRLDGSMAALASLQGQWLLVSVAGGACEGRCAEHLYLQRQLRESLGREKERLDWVWLVTDTVEPDAALRPALEQGSALRLPRAQVAQWLQPEAGHALEDHLYIVDPQGHWMMRLPAGMERSSAGRAKRDLERLLRASSSWDQPGR